MRNLKVNGQTVQVREFDQFEGNIIVAMLEEISKNQGYKDLVQHAYYDVMPVGVYSEDWNVINTAVLVSETRGLLTMFIYSVVDPVHVCSVINYDTVTGGIIPIISDGYR